MGRHTLHTGVVEVDNEVGGTEHGEGGQEIEHVLPIVVVEEDAFAVVGSGLLGRTEGVGEVVVSVDPDGCSPSCDYCDRVDNSNLKGKRGW